MAKQRVSNDQFVNDILMEIANEVESAQQKFPSWPVDPLHAMAVLAEEVGELQKAVLQETYEPVKNDKGDIYKEALQSGAMVVRFLMGLSKYEFTRSEQYMQSERSNEK